MKITMFISTLGSGGAERAMTCLSEEFSRRGHELTVVTWNNQVEDFYKLHESVRRISVEYRKSPFARWYDLPGNISRFRAIRKAIASTEPDAVISFLDGTNELFLLSSFNEKYYKILSCQVDMRMHAHYNTRWIWLRRWLYRLADKIVFLDRAQGEWANRTFPGWNCTGIPNPLPAIDVIPDKETEHVIEEAKRFPKRIVAMGRLAPQKGFDMLLDAFVPLADKFPDWGLVILGEGDDREKLEIQREKLGLQQRVMMPGRVSKPHAVIASSDIFAFSSRYEGQGLALLEAIACGVPAVSYDCPSGPSEILQHEKSGLLVEAENVEAFRKALERLMTSEEERLAMSDFARRSVGRYDNEVICRQWDALLAGN